MKKNEDYIVTFVNTPFLEKHWKLDYFNFQFFSRLSSLEYNVLAFSSRFLAFQVFGTNTMDIYEQIWINWPTHFDWFPWKSLFGPPAVRFAHSREKLASRLLKIRHLYGIWSGLIPYRLRLDTLSEYPEPWYWKISGSEWERTYKF